MCARYTLAAPADLLAERFGLAGIPELAKRYNIAPSQQIPIIGARPNGSRGLALFKWGFIPHWAQDDSGPKPVNAKSETVAGSVMFGDSFRKRRCLIPADGFYEWRAVGKKKFPIHYHLKDRSLFAFAGLWDVWNSPGGKLFTCTILTTTPNELTKQVHDRMPVILSREGEAIWLDPKVENADQLVPLLRPYAAEEMEALDANPAMNKATFEGPEALTPPAGELFA
jgi:putative SOS response-associated peptidase YedK